MSLPCGMLMLLVLAVFFVGFDVIFWLYEGILFVDTLLYFFVQVPDPFYLAAVCSNGDDYLLQGSQPQEPVGRF